MSAKSLNDIRIQWITGIFALLFQPFMAKLSNLHCINNADKIILHKFLNNDLNWYFDINVFCRAIFWTREKKPTCMSHLFYLFFSKQRTITDLSIQTHAVFRYLSAQFQLTRNDNVIIKSIIKIFRCHNNHYRNIHGLVQDCGISIADAMEIPQSCTKPWILCIIQELKKNNIILNWIRISYCNKWFFIYILWDSVQLVSYKKLWF